MRLNQILSSNMLSITVLPTNFAQENKYFYTKVGIIYVNMMQLVNLLGFLNE